MARAKRHDAPRTITAIGSCLKSDESVLSGRKVLDASAKLLFREGQAVEKGAVWSNWMPRYSVRKFSKPRPTLGLAKKSPERARDLFSKNFLFQPRRDEAESNFKSLRPHNTT